MKKLLLVVFTAIAIPFFGCSQAIKNTYPERIKIIQTNIWTHLHDKNTGMFYEDTNPEYAKKRHSYLWPLCALIQAADELGKSDPNNKHFDEVLGVMDKYYLSTMAPAPAYQAPAKGEENEERFYDDNQWIAIACMDAYNHTKNNRYLEVAKMIHRFQLTGYDDKAGGGLYWKEGDLTTKNTCSNGPAVLVALQLYKATNQKHYLDTALLIYNWTKKTLQSSEGLYHDNIRLPSLKIDSAKYTYNTGTMLQSAVLLYNITKDQSYLAEARRVAAAAEKHFYRNDRLPGNYWFNAVLLRGLAELYAVDKDKKIFDYFIKDAHRIWNTERDQNNLLGKKKFRSLIDQAAMIEIYARLEEVR